MSSDNSEGLYQSVTPDAGLQPPAWALPLSKEALFRIQLSLSSRRSSVMVLETVCRIFIGSLTQTSTTIKIQDLDPNATDWTHQTTGVPGLLVEYRDIKDMNIFSLKLVIVELESGLCTWEGKFGVSANYQVFAEDFHTFWMPGVGQVGIEFGDVSEGERMRVLLREWLEKLKTSFSLIALQEKEESQKKRKKKPSVIVRSESQPRFDKRQISTPCNFIHVSGITMTRTEECEKELQGTVRRFFRGAVASLSRTNTISPGSKSKTTLKDRRTAPLAMASSLGDLSGKDISKLSIQSGGESPESPQLLTRCDSSQSGREKKYFSLQRKKKQDESETSEFTRDNQSNSSLTPNSRRKGSVHSRVITSEEYFPDQESHQRRSTINTPNERSRSEQRKYSAPNIRPQVTAQWEPPEIWRQHSHIPTSQSDIQNVKSLNGTDQSLSRARFVSETNLPSYRPPPHPVHPSVTYPSHSNPPCLPNESNVPVPNHMALPNSLTNHNSEVFLPPIPFSLPPDFHTQPPPQLTLTDVPLRVKSYSTRRSEKTDQRRLSNSYTSFGHVGSSQVDV